MKVNVTTASGIISAIKAIRFLTGLELKECRGHCEAHAKCEGNYVTVEVETNKGLDAIEDYLNDPYQQAQGVKIKKIQGTEKVEIQIILNGPNANIKFKSDNSSASINTSKDKAMEITQWLLNNVL